MASREFEQALKFFPKGISNPSDPLDVVREKFAAAHGHDPGDDVQVERVELGGVPCVWVTPKAEPKPDRTLFFVHGGGFVSCAAEEYTFYAGWAARDVGARVCIVGYRLAPEHHFPAQLDDLFAAYQALVAAGEDPGRMSFLGDSCGGGMAVATLLRLRDAGEPLPACAVSLCGWFDLTASGDSARNPVGEDPFLDPEWLRVRGRDYVGPDGDPQHPLASPIHGDLSGLPPLLLQTGQMDRCRDDATRLAANAGRAGVAVTLEIWPEMIHGFQGLYGSCPEPVWAFRHVRDFVRHHVP